MRVPGVAVALTNEATTANGARTQYQITNTAKRVLDPQLAVVVQTSPDGTTWTTATGYTLNRLTGTVVFGSAQAVGTQIRIQSGSYLPLSTVAGAHGYSWTITAQQLNAADFDGLAASNGFATAKLTGQLDVQGTLNRWYQGDTFFTDALTNATVLVLELMPDRSASVPDFLAWALLDKAQFQAAQASVGDVSIDWQGTPDADGRIVSKP